MHKVKLIYWLLSSLILAATILIPLVSNSKENYPDLLLSGIAVAISIIAMGLSDPKAMSLQLNVRAWTVYTSTTFGMDGKTHRLSLRIYNVGKDMLEDVVIRIHYPAYNAAFYFRNSSNPQIKNYLHGDTKIMVDDTYGILDSHNIDTAYIQYDFDCCFDKWTKNNFYFTLTSKGYKSKTYKIAPSQISELKDATIEKPIILS